ncbi:hypothetical protein RJ639_045954, partial [Escallonia herrerae]
ANLPQNLQEEIIGRVPIDTIFDPALKCSTFAFLKTNAYMIVSINGIGCVIEVIYLALYVIYAPKKVKAFTVRMILLCNVGALGLIVLCSLFLVKGTKRVMFIGWACAMADFYIAVSMTQSSLIFYIQLQR